MAHTNLFDDEQQQRKLQTIIETTLDNRLETIRIGELIYSRTCVFR